MSEGNSRHKKWKNHKVQNNVLENDQDPLSNRTRINFCHTLRKTAIFRMSVVIRDKNQPVVVIRVTFDLINVRYLRIKLFISINQS